MNAFGSAIETKPENILANKGRVEPSSLAHFVVKCLFRTPKDASNFRLLNFRQMIISHVWKLVDRNSL